MELPREPAGGLRSYRAHAPNDLLIRSISHLILAFIQVWKVWWRMNSKADLLLPICQPLLGQENGTNISLKSDYVNLATPGNDQDSAERGARFSVRNPGSDPMHNSQPYRPQQHFHSNAASTCTDKVLTGCKVHAPFMRALSISPPRSPRCITNGFCSEMSRIR